VGTTPRTYQSEKRRKKLLRNVKRSCPGPKGGGYHFRKKLKVLLKALDFTGLFLLLLFAFNPQLTAAPPTYRERLLLVNGAAPIMKAEGSSAIHY
jgi:hypothetical protein